MRVGPAPIHLGISSALLVGVIGAFVLLPGWLGPLNPALALLLPVVYAAYRGGAWFGWGVAAVALAFNAWWLFVWGAARGSWGEFDLYRLGLALTITPATLLLTLRLRKQTEALANARLASEQARLERDLMGVKARLAEREKLAFIGAMVNGIAHEMRTPLTGVQNGLALVERRLQTMPQREREALAEALAIAHENTQRLAGLVERLRGRADDRLQRVPIDFDEAVGEAVRVFRAANEAHRGVSLIAGEPGFVDADAAAVQQALLCLLENAVEASPPGAPVVVTTRAADGMAELLVRDSGSGVPSELEPRILEEFTTTKPGRSGFGLAIVRRVAEGHGGSISWQTGRDGSTFRLTFPLAPAPPAAAMGSLVPLAP